MRRNSFTAVDLATIFAIGLTLLAIGLPAIARAKEDANAAKCQANLKAIGLAFATYAKSNNDLMPQTKRFNLPGWNAINNLNDPKGTAYLSWGEALVINGDVKQETNRNGMIEPASRHFPAAGIGLFACPSHVKSKDKTSFSKGRTLYGYGMAWCASSHLDPGEDKKPAIPVYSKKLVPGHIVAADGKYLMAAEGSHENPARFGVLQRHTRDNKNGANYLFADGHAEWSDVYGRIPSPISFGAELPRKVVADPPIWTHP